MLANLTPMLWLHFVAVLAALVAGVVQLLGPKGTARHRLGGRAYVVVMLCGNLGALTSYRLGFGVFHILAIVSLVSLALGLRALADWRRTGDPERLRSHRIHMAFSYLGLVMAGVSQALLNPRFGIVEAMPPAAYWGVFAAVNVTLYGLGSWAILTRWGAPRQS